jgi:hypothetical protein
MAVHVFSGKDLRIKNYLLDWKEKETGIGFSLSSLLYNTIFFQ